MRRPTTTDPRRGHPDSLGGAMHTILSKSGYVDPARAAEIDKQAAQANQQKRAALAAQLRGECGVFPMYAKAALADDAYARRRLPADQFARYAAARDELGTLLNGPGILVLLGPNGPGKTHLASALVHAFCDAGRSAHYCRAIDFFTQVKSTFGERGKTMEDLERRYRRFELLVLDEIEVRSDSTWENNLLRSLIDARHASLLDTVLVTNKSEEELHAYLSPAIRDRIRQFGGFVACDWPSLRDGAKGTNV